MVFPLHNYVWARLHAALSYLPPSLTHTQKKESFAFSWRLLGVAAAHLLLLLSLMLTLSATKAYLTQG